MIQAETWILKGYLPENSEEKAAVIIKDQKIIAVLNSQEEQQRLYPQLRVLETEDWILPGLINLHDHPESNYLPLWQTAHGQWNLRDDWRLGDEYRDEIKVFRLSKEIQPENSWGQEDRCKIFFYSELKALVNGSTTNQGSSSYECFDQFPVQQVESLVTSQGHRKMETMPFGILRPSLIQYFEEENLWPELSGDFSDYSELIRDEARKIGFYDWVDDYRNSESTEENAARLLGKNSLNSNDRRNWYESFANHTSTPRPFREAVSQASYYALNFWSPAHKWLQDYFAEVFYPEYVYGKLKENFASDTEKRLIIHIAEGRVQNNITQKTMFLALKAGLLPDHSILTHANGLSSELYSSFIKQGHTLVWSPVSNFLLYGETHKLEDLIDSGIQVAIAPDWSLSGSKSMMDEVQFAWKKYQSIFIEKWGAAAAQKFSQWALVNPAIALGMEKQIGRVAPQQEADIILVKKTSENAYLDFVEAGTKNLTATISDGQLMYSRVKEYFPENASIEIQWPHCQTQSPLYFKKDFDFSYSHQDRRTQESLSFQYQDINDYLAAFDSETNQILASRGPEVFNQSLPDTPLSECDQAYQEKIHQLIVE